MPSDRGVDLECLGEIFFTRYKKTAKWRSLNGGSEREERNVQKRHFFRGKPMKLNEEE